MTHPHHQLVETLLRESHGISESRLTPEARLTQDLGLDSVDRQLLALDLEAAFEDHHQYDLEISDAAIQTAETYQDLLTLLPTLK
jgi:acyl carrier protein